MAKSKWNPNEIKHEIGGLLDAAQRDHQIKIIKVSALPHCGIIWLQVADTDLQNSAFLPFR